MSKLKPEDKKLHDALNKAMEDDELYDTILEAALAKKCKELQQQLDALQIKFEAQCEYSIDKEKEIERLRKALWKYGSHSPADGITPICEKSKHERFPCTCGFEQALKGKKNERGNKNL